MHHNVRLKLNCCEIEKIELCGSVPRLMNSWRGGYQKIGKYNFLLRKYVIFEVLRGNGTRFGLIYYF